MRFAARRVDFLEEREIKDIVNYSLRILDEIGLKIEHPRMCERLAAAGAVWDGESGVRFPRKLVESHIETERSREPVKDDFTCNCGISSYPLNWLDPVDLKVKPHTARSTALVTIIADYLENVTGIGSVGVPSDIPPLLRPFWMRLVDWRYAQQTLANSYVIWDKDLCPFILEFTKTVVEMEPDKGGMKRYWRAHNYFVSPLHYAKEEAETFMWFHDRGERCTIGNLTSIGGTMPVTIAGAVGLALAESLAISFIMKTFYGDKGLSLGAGVVPLDMRTGIMPYGRPEQTLGSLAMTQVVNYLGSPSRGNAGHGTTSKLPDVECGYTKGMTAALQIALLGKLDYSIGVYSVDEITDPRLMVVDNEFVDGLKRLARGFEVSERTLPFDVVKEVGPGGSFLTHPHTFEHFREEMWLPDLFSGESLEAWKAHGSQGIMDKARVKVLEILDTYHPRGIKPETEEKLLSLIDGYAKKLGITDYKRPKMPE
jgi:trimethylamine--corrinoid protein Co-methyltransferase